MAKTPSETLREEISDDFHTYLRKGARFDRVVGKAHPNLDIDDIETLLRIHFVLTDAADDDDTDVGVLDFVRQLEDRIRRMKTATTATTFERRGEIRGRIDWPATTKRRARAGRFDEPVFVCRQPEEHYGIDENLVLKRLLSVIYDIVQTDLQYAIEHPDGYEWLSSWVTADDDVGRDPETAAATLTRIYERNVYLQRIDVATADVTDRTIESVKQSRSAFYREAAILLGRYRRLMDQKLENDDARSILENTIIAPDETETLFELYWIFEILQAYDAAKYHILTDSRSDPAVVAEWEQDDTRFVVSHDSTGTGLQFNESATGVTIGDDGYLFRLNEVVARWQQLATTLLDYDGRDTLWGGRPDIILERYERGEADEWVLEEIFVGEVKYTQDIGYVATGLRELLEYMAFVKDEDGEYVEHKGEVLESNAVHGLLFTDTLDRETDSPDDIEIIQYPESVGRINPSDDA